ncbi:hypothetical protein BH23ACT2_BH23ACT2_06130 [soil metagenome]
MSLRIRLHPATWTATFSRDQVVRLGRARDNDLRVGHQRVGGRWTVSKHHAELAWDGTRWGVLNVSDKPGLLKVYEPGYEEVPLEPGRPWVPLRHRWSCSVGHPDQPFSVICETDNHRGPATAAVGVEADVLGDLGDDPTLGLDDLVPLVLSPLERDVLLAYYSGFTLLPRPAILEPRSHAEAARRLGRSTDSARKAVERANEKIRRVPDAPPAATGRTVSSEIGRWLARTGAIDPLDRGGPPP